MTTDAECDREFDDRPQAIWAEVIGNGIDLMRSGMTARNRRAGNPVGDAAPTYANA